MTTPLSTAASYCTGAQFCDRYDYRTVGELLRDDDDAPTTPPSRSTVEGNSTLASLLLASSGEVEAACLVSSRYLPADLAALTGGAAAYLACLVADLTMYRLFLRRSLRDPGLKPPAACTEAREALDALRNGQRIFGTVEHAGAGVTQSPQDTAADVIDRNGLNVQAERFLGKRMWREWD